MLLCSHPLPLKVMCFHDVLWLWSCLSLHTGSLHIHLHIPYSIYNPNSCLACSPQMLLLLLLLLSHLSRVRLCATPEMAAHQAPPFLGFSRWEHWSGCHFLLQCMKVKSENEVAQSCPTPSDPVDYSPPGSSIHGIFQARVLEYWPSKLLYGQLGN